MNIAVITGASSGFGKSIAYKLSLKDLDEIWLIARSEKKMTELANKLPVKCKVIPLDLTKYEEINKYKLILEKFNPNIKLLVNSAGFGKFGDYSSVSIEDITDMIDLNIKATVLINKISLKYMKQSSKIMNVSSVSAFLPLPNFNIYSASKAFVYNYSRALALELKSRGITVTAVCPNWMDTDFIPIAKNSHRNTSVKYFPFISSPGIVAKKALDDTLRGRSISVYGLPAKLLHLISKILPNSLLMNGWLISQKNRFDNKV